MCTADQNGPDAIESIFGPGTNDIAAIGPGNAGAGLHYDQATNTWQNAQGMETVIVQPGSSYIALGYYEGAGATLIVLPNTNEVFVSPGVGEGAYIAGGVTSNLAGAFTGPQISANFGPISVDPTTTEPNAAINNSSKVGFDIGLNFGLIPLPLPDLAGNAGPIVQVTSGAY